MKTEQDKRIIERVKELTLLNTERIIEAGYKIAVQLPSEQNEELRAVFQALWTRTFYRAEKKFE